MAKQWNQQNSRKSLARVLLAAAFAGLLPLVVPAVAAGSDRVLREARPPAGASVQPAPKYSYLFSPTARWTGPLRWKYNHANAPQMFADKAAVIEVIRRSFEKWSSQCGVSYVYEGETTAQPNTVGGDSAAGEQPDGASVVGWGPLDPSFGAYTYAWYWQNGSERVIFDADITLSTTAIVSLADLERLVTHEWGHALGLDHSDVDAAVMAGPPATAYNQLVSLQADDLRGCRCLYGLPSGVSAPYACSVPSTVDFGDAAIGASTTTALTLVNSGNAPLSFQASTVADAQFRHVAGCTPGTAIAPGESCTMQMSATPSAAGTMTSKIALFTNDGYYEMKLAAHGRAGAAQALAGPTVEVVEYYNAELGHYFITWIAAEMANLDAGVTPTRWTRTGRSWKAFAAAQPATSEVCRVYIPPALGDSHFFGRGSAECAASQQKEPALVLEDPDYMHVVLPNAGACPGGLRPVYRVFNNRANHRYMVDRALRDEMVAKGWTAEGDGPDRVVMCAPV